MQTAKESARTIIDRLPDQATWEDIMYEFYLNPWASPFELSITH